MGLNELPLNTLTGKERSPEVRDETSVMREGLSRRLQGAYSGAAASFPQGACCIRVMLLEVTAEPPTLVTLSCYLLTCHCGCGAVPGSVLAEVVQVKSNFILKRSKLKDLFCCSRQHLLTPLLPSARGFEFVPDVCFLGGAEPPF